MGTSVDGERKLIEKNPNFLIRYVFVHEERLFEFLFGRIKIYSPLEFKATTIATSRNIKFILFIGFKTKSEKFFNNNWKKSLVINKFFYYITPCF